ncbi:MAG: FkbM family methyltransferase [Actinomycetota bacterium]
MAVLDVLGVSPAGGGDEVRSALDGVELSPGRELLAMSAGALAELDGRLASGDRLGVMIFVTRLDPTRQALRWLHDELPAGGHRYDAVEVNRRLGILLADRARWARWWDQRRVAPVSVDFEALLADPGQVADLLVRALGLVRTPLVPMPSPDPDLVDLWHAHHCRLPIRREVGAGLTAVQLEMAGRRYELEVDRNEFVGREIVLTGRPYEANLLDGIARRLPPGADVVDVGAHIGNHAIALAALGHRVVAIEPNPASRRLLEANVVRNGLAERVAVVAGGAGASTGRAQLAIDPENTGATRLLPGTGTVDVHRLDDLVRRADLVKVDVEGAEREVLAGAERLLRESRPLVLAEAHDDDALRSLRAALAPLGYATDGVSLASDPTYLFEPAG